MKEIFNNIPRITYEGKNSKNDFAFKYYNPNEKIGNKTMKEHLRFAMSYWHTLTGTGVDPFGAETMVRPWNNETDPMVKAKLRVRAAFEFMEKLGLKYFCFHDIDIAPEGNSLIEKFNNLDEITSYTKELMNKTGIKLLWATSNMFTHPRFVHGAATSCNADVFAFAAAQVKKMLDITKELGGENYVFWGGREGYETLLNTDTKLELDNLARFLHMAVDYAKKIGFKGQLLIEPKPKEPSKHQYDFDTSTVLGFLRKYNLQDEFKINIEANHATLAGHTFQHEINMARINGVLGSLDVNQGDTLLGWDTDQFPTNIYDAVLVMYEVLKNGGIHPGGLNFDAKVRRASFAPEDLFYAYIAGMDTFAKGLRIADKLLKDSVFENIIKKRYDTYTRGIGKDIIDNKIGFEKLTQYALNHDHIINVSGRQEKLEHILNQYILGDY